MKVHELTPQYDSGKSFYGKAKILKDGKTIKLQSYDTIVAEYDPFKKTLKINGWYSATTARHINEFIYQWASFFSTMMKKEMELKPLKTLKK